MRYTKHFAMIALAAALLAGCAADEQLGTPDVPETVAEAQPTAQTQPALTPEQQLIKQNLDAAAQLLVAALNKPMVQRELHQLDYEKIRTDRLGFEQLLRSPAKDGQFRSLATELGRSLNAGAKGSDNLADYLIEQGCELYMPYPLEWYPADAPITVAGHPIDNVEQGIGYVVDKTTGTLRTVLVNDEYADKNPVAIIMQPQGVREGRPIMDREELMPDPDWGGGGGGGSSSSSASSYTATVVNRSHVQDASGKRYKVKLGEVFCSMKTNLFEGDIELRMEAVPLGTNDAIALIEMDIPKAYVKSAYNGWSHSNGGWFDKKKCDLFLNWIHDIVAVGVLAYEYDPEKSWSGSIGLGVTVKGTGGNISYSRNTSNEKLGYSGDLFGKVIWGRSDFIDLNANPTAIDETRNGWRVWTIGSNLKFTIKWCWY